MTASRASSPSDPMISGVRASSMRMLSGFVDQGEVHPALDRLLTCRTPTLVGPGSQKVIDIAALGTHEQSVSQKIEAELLGSAIRDIRTVGLATLVLVVIGQDDPNFKSQRVEQGTHPVGIAMG